MMQKNLNSGRFEGRTAIVTGAGAGIGRATALRFIAEGARVVATDVSADRLQALTVEIGSDRLVTVAGDISSEATAQAVVSAAAGRVDILANIAGIADGFLPLGEVDDETWERVFAVNVTAVMRLSRAVLPLMVAAQKGAIVNITSEAGLRGSCAGVAYTASKHAVIGMTKSASFMYSPNGIRVNAIAPGPVTTSLETPMKSELAAARFAKIREAVLPPRAEAEEIAAHICWLASDEAANITGVVLPSDGGWSAI